MLSKQSLKVASLILAMLPVVASAQKPELVLQTGMSEPVTVMVFSPDGRYLAACARTASAVKLFDVATGSLLRALDTASASQSVSAPALRFSADSHQLQAYTDGTYSLWDVESGRVLRRKVLAAPSNRCRRRK